MCGTLPISILAILLLTFAAIGQETDAKIDCTIPFPSNNTKRGPIVSLGVVNSRAIHLSVPKYPAAALAVDVRGNVTVLVLIDPRGCVAEAKVVSGHQLLAAGSVAAAKESIFEPATVSANPVFAHGVIVYKYVTDEMNWLELGFNSDDIDKMLEFLPIEIAQRYALYEQKLAGIDESELLTQIRSAVLEHGAADAKNIWLFKAGEHIREIERSPGLSSLKTIGESIRGLINSAPETIDPKLLDALRPLVETASNDELPEIVRELKIKMYFLGN